MTVLALALFRHCYSNLDQNQEHITIHGVMLIVSLCDGKLMRTHLSLPRLPVRREHGDVNCDVESQYTQLIHRYSASAWFTSW